MDVVVVGSCNTDLFSYVSHLPKEGETVTGYKFDTGFGGKGGNQCIAAVKLGAKVAMIGKLGNDIYGREYLNNLKAYSVNCDYVGIEDGESTGVAAISVADNGYIPEKHLHLLRTPSYVNLNMCKEIGSQLEVIDISLEFVFKCSGCSNSIIIVPGANNKLSVTDVEAAESVIKSAKVLVCQNEVPQDTSLTALKLASKHGVKTVFNAAPAQENFHTELFKVCDIFCVNETEAETLVGKQVHSVETASWACDFLIKSKECNSVIVTLGEKGAVFQYNKSAIPVHIPATVVKAVDTTGAGDSFVGSLAFFLATRPDLTVPDVIQRAGHIASFSVTKAGTQKSFPTAAEILPHILT